ncbi:MAG: GGDEF domain-containing protein [Pseudodesulfovibrio sp.]|nr:GGDEF domain-containing protein [Pseudodesulfovibrio sp.]
MNDLKGNFIDGNRAAEELTGFKRNELIGKSFAKLNLLDLKYIPKAIKALSKNIMGQNFGPEEFILNRKDNSQVHVEIRSIPIKIRDEAVVLGIARDITKRKQVEEAVYKANQQLETQLTEIKELQDALREQVIRDPLTGVFNRRYMNEVLKQEIARAMRKKQPLSIVMLDIDYLKKINDIHGHVSGGDKALQALADTIKQMCRAEDTVCRYGGDEFVVILYDTPAQVACERATQWKGAVAEIQIASGKQTFGISFSAGVAAFPAHGSTDEEILTCADQALYRAKELGRDRTVIYQQGSST